MGQVTEAAKSLANGDTIELHWEGKRHPALDSKVYRYKINRNSIRLLGSFTKKVTIHDALSKIVQLTNRGAKIIATEQNDARKRRAKTGT